MASRRRFPLFVPLLFGLMLLTNVMTRPRVATYHAVDVVSLIVVGMCFGAALVAFITVSRDRRSADSSKTPERV